MCKIIKSVFLSILFLMTTIGSFGNMAEPTWWGTQMGSPFVSQYVDIIHEDILITPHSEFRRADFQIRYEIDVLRDGDSIPLLFYAIDYQDEFEVFLDGKPIDLWEIPDSIKKIKGSKFEDFAFAFKTEKEQYRDYALIEKGNGLTNHLNISELKYFQVDLSKGLHEIEVRYQAKVTEDRWNWVTEYQFWYSLSPASYWKSYGTLDVRIDDQLCSVPFTCNLGGQEGQKRWTFSSLPNENIQLIYSPKISNFSSFLISVGPMNFSIFIAVLGFLLHLFNFKKINSKVNGKKRFIIHTILIIFIPLLALILGIYSYDLIDWFIGKHASGNHGYSFLMIIFYPLYLLVYLALYLVMRFQMKSKI